MQPRKSVENEKANRAKHDIDGTYDVGDYVKFSEGVVTIFIEARFKVNFMRSRPRKGVRWC